MTIKVVFFDMYGTLAGFRPPRYEVQSEACRDFGIEVTPEGIVRGYAAADAYMTERNAKEPVRLRSEAGREAFFAEYERLVLRGVWRRRVGGDGREDMASPEEGSSMGLLPLTTRFPPWARLGSVA